MAALPYMQLYVADYLADTAHLTTEEHGAYLLLLFSYWQTGKPLRGDRLASVARLPNERWESVEPTLKEFFHVDDGVWTHFRVEADLEKVDSKSKKNSNAGKASAKAKALAKQALKDSPPTDVVTPVATNVEQTHQRKLNHPRSGDTDTDTDTEQDQKHLSPSELDSELPLATEKRTTGNINLKQLIAEGCDEQHAKDWLAVRKTKKAPLTVTAWSGVKAEAEKAGMTPAQAVAMSAENGWQGFKAAWAQNAIPKKTPAQANHSGFDERNYHDGLIDLGDGQLGF